MFPRYKHVEEFGQDDEYEEAEVSYVTLDLGSNINKALLPNTSEYRLVGLDTPTPMLQLSGTFFKGGHEELIGTEILFTDGRDESDLSRKFVVPVATTEKRIKFEQVEAYPREQEQEGAVQGRDNKAQARRHTNTRGRGRFMGRGRGSGRGRLIGSLMHEYGEKVVDLR